MESYAFYYLHTVLWTFLLIACLLESHILKVFYILYVRKY